MEDILLLILHVILIKSTPQGQIDNSLALVQMMSWWQAIAFTNYYQLTETYICIQLTEAYVYCEIYRLVELLGE